ncbi:MAG: hypothetical protein CMO81_00875 [Waddliaceae bacterium]|nr:hypothetical protein [Waddliaceae bacterium]|tara:strand:- start:124 stop:309 length:186 start_codon:yes stop_codon:yes gene_type:complete
MHKLLIFITSLLILSCCTEARYSRGDGAYREYSSYDEESQDEEDVEEFEASKENWEIDWTR